MPFLLESAKPRSLWRRAISNFVRHAQIDLRSDARAAPDGQFRADQFGSFAHPRKAEVSCAAVLQNFAGKAFAVISNFQAKDPQSVADFNLNMAGMGVLECIGQGLSREAVELVPDDGGANP
jgi:hypothetical protein